VSRIGKQPIAVPDNVDVQISGLHARVKGPLGELQQQLNGVNIELADKVLSLTPLSMSRKDRALWGLSRSLLNNMIIGVSHGFERKLEINGVGYRAEAKGQQIVFTLGHSHSIEFPIPQGIKIELDTPTAVKVSGVDKQLVGQTAARIRALRPPEPYKGKGVKYAEEYIRRKAGKTA
jgi:large subunit ribosomal protein L6